MKPEFDQFSDSYEALLKDPVRDRFMGGSGDFFHRRKRDLIRAYFHQRGVSTSGMTYLDLGCGKGELAGLLSNDFGKTCGCDPSEGMLKFAPGIETRPQTDPEVIPFADASFDFVTAVCVYHHVPLEARARLTAEVARVLKPGGTFAIIEHNPKNPFTRAIVKRTPVDADAILLPARETEGLLSLPKFEMLALQYFLYLPEKLYGKLGAMERLLTGVSWGGQYAAFAKRTAAG
jgi:ubiquinone/menaquinone biosynthesis C-methylase UbiE